MPNANYPKMFSEYKIGNVTIPNRLVMAPMGVGYYGEFFEERLIEFYGARARGGIGLVLTENNYVSSFEEDPYPEFMPVPRFDSAKKISRAHAIATRIKEYGGVAGIQLGAGQGRNVDSIKEGFPPMSASPCPVVKYPDVMCKEMTKEDIKAKVDAFERAARLAVQCGFQIIEVHAHSGYLLEQFFSKDLNKRTDEYGGSAENRFRFAKEILEGIRRGAGDKVGVSIRMSVDHKTADGITLEEGLEYCRLAEAAGYDALHLDAGARASLDWTVPSPYLGQTPLVSLAEEAKKVVNIPVITVGSVLMPQDAEDILEKNQADFVAIGRALLADPDWAMKAKTGKADRIRGCIQCSDMCAGNTFTNKCATCSVNPTCGHELEFRMEPADEPKRVTIVGAGPAGIVAGLIAQKRGHEVKILEKSDSVGGNMNIVSLEEDKRGVKNYRNYLRRQAELKKLDIEFNCEATIEKIRETEPDAVVVATGAYLFIPNIPGFRDNDKVYTIKSLYEEAELKGDEKIVILGGGVNGCEVGLALAKQGHKVTIVEMAGTYANGLGLINGFSLKTQMAQNKNITLMLETKCKCIDGDEFICEDKDGNEVRLPYDIVIAASGMKEQNGLGKQVLDEFPEAYLIGDAVVHQRIGEAVHQGFFTGLRI